MTPFKIKTLHLILFFISMAMLESAVVIYLRELLYPEGFIFPLVDMKPIVILTELARELATILMLWTISYIAGSCKSSRFAWFIIGFGIWDIFYYVFLYIFIHWPLTFIDWDILFLIPLPWYGPVIAPIIISIEMILLGFLILKYSLKNQRIIWHSLSITLMISGCFIALWTFMGDFILTLKLTKSLTWSENILYHSQTYIPKTFPYGLFFIACSFLSSGIYIFVKTNKVKK